LTYLRYTNSFIIIIIIIIIIVIIIIIIIIIIKWIQFQPDAGAFWSGSCAEMRHGLSRRRDNVDRLPLRLFEVFIVSSL